MPKKPIVYLIPDQHIMGYFEKALKLIKKIAKNDNVAHWGFERPTTELKLMHKHEDLTAIAFRAFLCHHALLEGKSREYNIPVIDEVVTERAEGIGVKAFNYDAPFRIWERSAHYGLISDIHGWDRELLYRSMEKLGAQPKHLKKEYLRRLFSFFLLPKKDREHMNDIIQNREEIDEAYKKAGYVKRLPIERTRKEIIKKDLPKHLWRMANKVEKYIKKNRALLDKHLSAEALRNADYVILEQREKYFLKNIEKAAKKHGVVGILMGEGHISTMTKKLRKQGIVVRKRLVE